MIRVDNAIILSAGVSSRFVPLCFDTHKALLNVKGEVLIERQIKQLLEIGIKDIYVVVGYKANDFKYLEDSFGVKLLYNSDYMNKNSISSVFVAKDYIKNSYICSSDNYYVSNPFKIFEEKPYYSTVYSKNYTNEWCVEVDSNKLIQNVHIGGKECFYMLGHSFWDESFSKTFISLLENHYNDSDVSNMLWESFYKKYINRLNLFSKTYQENEIFEFDSFDELRKFDENYLFNIDSEILEFLSSKHSCEQRELYDFKPIYGTGNTVISGFKYRYNNLDFIFKYNRE